MRAVRETKAMIAGMAPVLRPGRFVFVTGAGENLAPQALASFREAEGLSLILAEETARAQGFDTAMAMACITLTVHSALDGIGLTAAVAGALTQAGIPCNMVAAFHHDHVFVPVERAEEAVAVLQAAAEAAGAGAAASGAAG